MIRTGYDSSDDDDDDMYDFGYSDPLIKRSISPTLPPIQTKSLREELHSALEHSKKLDLFFRAIDEEDLEVLEELISLGVSVDSSGPQEWTPLMKACSLGKVVIVRFLLEHGSDPNLSKELFTALMACCTFCSISEHLKLECVRLLIQYGAKVNTRDKYRTTALMYAAGSGYAHIVNELLEVNDIDVNLQDKEGWNAIFYAVNSNHTEIVKKLISAGSKLNFKDRYDRTVLNLALDRELLEVAEILGFKEENLEKENEPAEIDLLTLLLKEFPDSNGLGGFSSDAQAILTSLNYSNLKEISFPDFLNASNDDLYDIGIKFEYDRYKILKKVIHEYHLYSWKKTSMPQIDNSVPLSMEKSITFAANLVKHLVITNASFRYLYKRISPQTTLEGKEMASQKEMIEVFVNTFQVVEKIKGILQKVVKHIEEIEPSIPGDYIGSYQGIKERGKIQKFLKCFWYVMGITSAGYIIYHFKS